MRRILYIIILLACCNNLISSQTWVPVNSGTTLSITDIFFLDKNVGWFITSEGVLKKSVDGGNTWILLDSLGQDNRRIQFLDINNGYLLGGGPGSLYKTTDGGTSWSPINTGYNVTHDGMDFVTPQIGWVVGGYGIILKTTDGGQTWTNQSPITNEYFKDIDFIDQNVGNVVGTGGKIYRSYLGGSDWSQQMSNTLATSLTVQLIDYSNAWTKIDQLKKTTNGGSTWPNVDFLYNSIADLFFLNKDTGWVVADNGLIGATTDGGENFSYNTPIPSQYYYRLFFIDYSTGWIAGNNGVLLKYVPPQNVTLNSPNGGEIWSVGSTHNITWTQTGVTNVNLEYTTNNGTFWNQIIASTSATTGSYAWTIPNAVSRTAKVRITDNGTGTVADQSDNDFTITNYFEEVPSVTLPGLEHSAVAWGDYNNDGNLDFILTGQTDNGNASKIYKNIGDGTFVEQSSIIIAATASASVHWGDFNNDGYLDILISGFNSDYTGWISKVYKNDNGVAFSEVAQTQIQNCHNGSSRWGDYDNDGDLDILLTGGGGVGDYFAKVYRNNGNETFSELSNLNLTGINYSTGEWGDYDNDEDLDILITGYSLEGIITRIYRNEGGNTFSHQTQILLPGVWQGTAIWGDYNNDSFLDISLTGKTTEGSLISKIYRNNGDNTFTEQVTIPFEGVYLSSTQWGDFNNDGINDFIISGWNTSEIEIAKFYKNNGNNTFTDFEVPLQAVKLGSMAAADYNNDGSLDILVSGLNNSDRYTKLYQNRYPIPNSPPVQPSDLISNIADGIVNFSWSKSTDDHTPQDGINYNIAIGNSPGIYNIVSPMADKTTGKRSIARMGNCQTNSWHIKGLLPGTYYWSVQAIDGSYLGSQFAQEQSFTIPQTGNYSLYFDGNLDYVGDMIENKLRDNATFTLELWVKNQSPNVAPLITRGADSGVDWSYNLYSHDRLYFGVNSPPGYVSNTPPSSNEWHHIAAVKSADGYLMIFIDGIKVNELSYGVASLVSSHSLQFGKYFANASSDYFKGFLTKIRISKIARYQNSFTPIINYSLDTNTVGLWNFYGGSGNTLYDASGNGIDGTIYGATWSTDFPQVPAAISLTSPNGGENWTVGSVQNITWAYNGVQNVKLEYTLNNGTSWNQIVGSTSASTGSYSWTIPNSVSNNCKVRITDAGNNSITDQSDAFFTISAPAATITLTSPNGGENWTVGSTHNITWSQTGVTNVKLEYTSNNGTSWNQIVASTSASTGSYSWEIPNSVSNICKVKVTSTINSLVSDESNAQFTISTIPVPVVTITSPNGGENWLAGSQYSISWNSSNVQNLKMEYSVNGGTNWSLINAAVPANLGSYIWTIPNTPSSTCKVKITSVENGTVFDESNSNFTISEAPTLVLVSPNGGENWFAGNQYSITWNFVNVQKLKLEYSSNNGSDWNSIDSSVTPNLGSYIWTVPNTPSTSCKVRITAMENGPVSDQSDGVFSISEPPSVRLSSPVGGEKWLSGKQYSIIWSFVNIENVKLEYSANNGLDWTTIEASFAANSGSYIWTVPAIESNQCLVQISAVNNPSISDQSDAPFTIEPERTLSLTAPAGGEVFTSGEKMAITWNSLNLETIDLYYSVDNGGYWGLIADSVDASLSTFNWDIPENNSNQVKIRLVYTRKPELRSEIVNTLTILPSPKVTLQSNLSAAFLKSGTNQLIEWLVENVSAVNLFYSSDGGTVWNEIALNIPSTTRSHNWVVPQLNSKNCRIKVVSSVNPDLSNSSAGYFTIYTYSESISLVNTWQFGDIKEINNYRLVSMPGNTTENLVNVISGKHIEEWNAYWDNGNDVNYQVQYDGSEIFKFQPGKGFWVLSKNPINLNKQLAAVTIDSTLIFNVSVHRGWNIIGNPFAKSLNWSEIRSINSLPQNRLIYYWDGKWNFPTQMEPFKGYYFFNEDNRSNLKFVYPVEASLAKTGIENQFQNITDGISISFGDNEIFAVFNEAATTGLDTNDYLLPGITFSNKNLSFLRDTEDGKKRQLFIESQPMDTLGNSFRIRATNTSGEASHLQIKPRIDLGTNNIYLLDEKFQEFIDVRSNDKFTIIPQEESRYYTLLIGSDGFIKSVMTKYLPTEYILYQNYPNPFNPETSIKYALPEDSQVKIKLYDILGNEVITLFEGEEPAGVHTRTFDLSSFASGVYLYRLETRNKSFVKKMVLLR